jgi:hypothetical protein
MIDSGEVEESSAKLPILTFEGSTLACVTNDRQGVQYEPHILIVIIFYKINVMIKTVSSKVLSGGS